MLDPEAVSDAVLGAVAAERFLVLPHPEVADRAAAGRGPRGAVATRHATGPGPDRRPRPAPLTRPAPRAGLSLGRPRPRLSQARGAGPVGERAEAVRRPVAVAPQPPLPVPARTGDTAGTAGGHRDRLVPISAMAAAGPGHPPGHGRKNLSSGNRTAWFGAVGCVISPRLGVGGVDMSSWAPRGSPMWPGAFYRTAPGRPEHASDRRPPRRPQRPGSPPAVGMATVSRSRARARPVPGHAAAPGPSMSATSVAPAPRAAKPRHSARPIRLAPP